MKESPSTTPSEENMVRQGVSLPPTLLADARVKGGANFSAYIRDLIERDLAGGSPDVLAPSIMVDLARRLCGELVARDLAAKLGDADQPRKLAELLRASAAAQNEPANDKGQP